jgi:hypothetical protein
MWRQMRRFKEAGLRQGARAPGAPEGRFQQEPETHDFRAVLANQWARAAGRRRRLLAALARLTKTGRSRISRAIVRDGPALAGGGSFGP